MKSQYSIILKEFKPNEFISIRNLKAFKEKLIISENLNIHEKNFVKYKKSYFLLPYSTINIYDLHSYYVVEFDHKEIKDIIELRVLKEKFMIKEDRYVTNGFKFYDLDLMSQDKEKRKHLTVKLNSLLNEYFKKYEGISDNINFDHPDNLISVLDPKNNVEAYIY